MAGLDLSLIGQKSKENLFKYTWKDVVLYAIGIGAQVEKYYVSRIKFFNIKFRENKKEKYT